MAFFFGNNSDNTLSGSNSSDLILGRRGDDDIDGRDGNDLLFGGRGDDLARGGDGKDAIFGDRGDDRLIGDRGDDFVFGGRGDDLMIWNNGDGSDRMDGGRGYDQVQVNGADGPGDDLEVGTGASDVLFQRKNLGLFELDISDVESMEINGNAGDDTLTVKDLAGTDLEEVTFNGGAGDDTLDGTEATTGIEASGGTGNDTMSGSSAVDTFEGDDGDDLLVGNRGNDQMFGGDGNDRFIWNNGDGSDRMDGGADYDVVEVNGADGAGDDFEVGAGASDVLFQRKNLGLFELDISDVESMEINGQGGDDTLTVKDLAGTDLQEVIFDGGAGDDTLDGTQATTGIEASGGTGNDTTSGSSAADTFEGDGGDDLLVGNRGNDQMFGGDGDDRFIWNNGDGSDRMDGGADYDVVEVNGADGPGDEFEVGAGASDVLFQRKNLGLFELDISDVESMEINGQGGDDTLTVKDLAGTDLQGVTFSGGDGSDTFDGTAATVALEASGDDGADVLLGGLVDDILSGGLGNDDITGGLGSDVLSGGGGEDEFIFNQGDGGNSLDLADLITDFENDIDTLVFSGPNITELGSLNIVSADTFGGNAGDAAIQVAETGEILAVVANTSAADLFDDIQIIV